MEYTNTQQFNRGLRFMTTDPADDRLVLSNKSELYTTDGVHAPLYNRAYAGMQVVVADTWEILILVNDAPYKPGYTGTKINATNYPQFWKKNAPVVDNDTIKILNPSTVNEKLTGMKFKVTKNPIPDESSSIFSSFKLQVLLPGASAYTDISGSADIEIPKVEAVDEVHVCKAVKDPSSPGGYRETARQDDPDWETADGDVMLHVIWALRDDDGNPDTNVDGRETYIDVGDMIKIDVSTLERDIQDLSTNRVATLESKVNTLENETIPNLINDTVTPINASVADLSTNRVAGLERRMNTMEDRTIPRIDDDVNTLKNVTVPNLINDTVNPLNASVYDLSTNRVATLESKVNTLESVTVPRIDQDVNTLKNETVPNLINDTVNPLAADVLDLSTNRVKALEEKSDTLETEIMPAINAHFGNIESRLVALDASNSSIFDILQENELTWAAAWNQFNTLWNQLFVLNPTLRKPGEPEPEVHGIYYKTLDTSIELNEVATALDFYDHANNIYEGMSTDLRYCYLAVPEGNTFTVVNESGIDEHIEDDFHLVGTVDVSTAPYQLYCMDQNDLPLEESCTITIS